MIFLQYFKIAILEFYKYDDSFLKTSLDSIILYLLFQLLVYR